MIEQRGVGLVRALDRRLKWLHFDWRHRREARAARAAIEAVWPDHALGTSCRAEIRRYARGHLGSTAYAPWLEAYTAWRGEFCEGWMPDNYLGRYVVPYSTADGQHLITNTLARRLLDTDCLPDLGYMIQGQLRDLHFEPQDIEAFAERIFAQYPYVYLKSADSMQGKDVCRIHRSTFAAAIHRVANAVVQAPIEIHPSLERLSPGAAATLRITTVFQDGPPRPVAAYLRLGREGNTHVTSRDAIRVPVADLTTGRLGRHAALPDWSPIETHPDTGSSFADVVVPHFAEAVAATGIWHGRLPHVRYIGWDVAIRPDGTPALFEANSGHADIKFSEATTGPIFAGLGWDRLHRQAVRSE